jgi:hypothetical protein
MPLDVSDEFWIQLPGPMDGEEYILQQQVFKWK